MLVIFVEEVSERLLYTLDFVLNERGVEYYLTNDYVFFQNSNQKRFNYSDRHFTAIPQISPSSVLFDEFLVRYEVQKSKFRQEECLSFDGITDPLASVFYVLTRMEEYGNVKKDEHGRFSAKQSIQYTFGWLNKAMCDRWSEQFIEFLKDGGCELTVAENSEKRVVPTFDIDNTYAYKWKEGPRQWLSIARDLLQRKSARLAERRQVLSGKKEDPYDTYDTIEEIALQGFDVKLFWLLGDYAQYDKNISHYDNRQRRLINRMKLVTQLGIHPSYKSGDYPQQVRIEKERLEAILSEKVIHSRQHFLRLSFPQTYLSLLDAGIEQDYTMGFADHVGFRMGTARSVCWFNLTNNHRTNLQIHPFMYMDGTLHEYMFYSINQAKECIDQLYEEVNKYGGDFTFIWHNETIGNYGKWKNWKEVLDYTLALR